MGPSVGELDHGRRDFNAERLQSALRKSMILFVNLTAKFPLVFLFLLIVVYAIPASIAVVAVYILVRILFAVPSFLVLYFAYPSLDWLVTEIVAVGSCCLNVVFRSYRKKPVIVHCRNLKESCVAIRILVTLEAYC